MEMFNQTQLTTIGSTPNSNKSLNNDLHKKIMNRQPASTLDTNDNQGQSLPHKMTCDADPIDQIGHDPIKNLKKKIRQVVVGIGAVPHTPELCNKVFQELNHNG